jgi:UDP-glucose 4-epimerase
MVWRDMTDLKIANTGRSMTVLIVGVTGFIGRHLARQFARSGWTVIGIGTRSTENSPVQDLSAYFQLSLPSKELADIVQTLQFDLCVHCVGRASVELSMADPVADFRSSVDATINILDAIRKCSPKSRVIYLSSAAVYGNPGSLPISESHLTGPISPYGFHKLMCEQLMSEYWTVYGIESASVRIFSAYGPGLRRQVLWDLCQKLATQPVVKLRGTGNESRDFIHVLDVANAIQLLAMQPICQAEVFNLASGREVTVAHLAELIRAEFNSQVAIEFDQAVMTGVPKNWRADISKIEALGYRSTVDLESGIAAFARWARRENGSLS